MHQCTKFVTNAPCAPRRMQVRTPYQEDLRMRTLALSAALACLVFVSAPVISAQLGNNRTISTLDLSTSSSTLLVFANGIVTPDPTSTQEELPGLGHKFELFGAMVQDTDPENAVGNSGGSGGGVGGNETVSATMTPTAFALAFRNLPPGIRITALDNQLGLKYYFQGTR